MWTCARHTAQCDVHLANYASSWSILFVLSYNLASVRVLDTYFIYIIYNKIHLLGKQLE